jgi:hypothetical protein
MKERIGKRNRNISLIILGQNSEKNRYINNIFEDYIITTIGIDFKIKNRISSKKN